MRDRRALVVTALVTVGLGAVAVVSGSTGAAALAGLGAIVAAALSLGRRPPVAEPAEPRPPLGAVDDIRGPSNAGELVASLATKPPRIFDETTLARALFSRVAMARRALRPLSLIHLEVLEAGERNHGRNHEGRNHDGGSTQAADRFEQMLEATLRESDVCGRRADGVYVFILEDTGEDGAVWTAERLRRNLVASTEGIRFCAGIASYPNHGLEAQVLDAKAAAALDVARQWHRDRIEVADGP